MFDQTQETGVPSVFHVSKDCLKQGKSARSDSCALAVSAKNEGCSGITVSVTNESDIYDGGRMEFSYQDNRYGFDLDQETTGKLLLFDQGLPVNPFLVVGNPQRC